MTAWDAPTFERHAQRLASRYWDGDGSLRELARKVARDESLNAEQIRRLCRAANTHAFEQRLAALKDEADRTVTFDQVDPEDVVGDLHGESVVAKAASASYPSLDDAWAPKLPERVKVAEAPAPTVDPLDEARRLDRAADELVISSKMADHRWVDAMERLRGLLREADVAAFEKNALAVVGPDVVFELNALRATRGQAPVTASTEKLAGVSQSLYGRADATTANLRTAIDARRAYREAKLAADQARAKAVLCRQAARGRP